VRVMNRVRSIAGQAAIAQEIGALGQVSAIRNPGSARGAIRHCRGTCYRPKLPPVIRYESRTVRAQPLNSRISACNPV